MGGELSTPYPIPGIPKEKLRMSRFSLKTPVKLIIVGASTSVVQNAQGAAVAINHPSKTVEIKAGIYITEDIEIIERIRRDIHYNTPDGIIEISEEDIEAASIRDKKLKEADIEIKEAKKKRQSK